MIYATQEFKDAMWLSILEVYIKMEIMDSNENIISIITEEVTTDSVGDISVDSSRDIRRMFTLKLNNAKSKYTWNENGLIWIDNKRIKLYIGLMTSNGIQYVPQGVFVITSPEATHKPLENTVSISGQDKWYLLTGNFGKFTHETTIPKGTNIKNAIRIVANGGGITDDKMILDDTDITLPYDLTYQIGQNRGEALKDLTAKAFDTGNFFYDIYFDINGYLRFEKHKDPTLEAPCVTYQIQDVTLYAGSNRRLDDTNLFNHILVLGGSGQTASFRTELIIDETLPQWVGHPYSIQKIGDRFFPYNDGNPDSNIDTQAQCNARATFELDKNLQFTERVSLDLAPNYLHEANDVIAIYDVSNGCYGNHQLTSFSVPIRPKIVTAEAFKVRSELV